jgi:rhodanese-related sulfurtransferase
MLFLGRYFITSLLILLMFTGVAARGEESPVPSKPPATNAPADLKALMNVDQFKADLPVNNDELHLQGLLDLKKQGPVAVLDVRSKDEFARRHLRGSVNIPLTDLTDKTAPAVAPDKNTPVVLACTYSFEPTRMTAGTIQAYPVLKAAGYTKIYRLNLWETEDHQKMLSSQDEEKALEFEGTDVKPAADAAKKP